MDNKRAIKEELTNLYPAIAGIGQSSPYTVPATYFEHLTNNILTTILAEEYTTAIPVSLHPYTVAPEYFTTFADRILSRISIAGHVEMDVFSETAEVAPLLNTISKQMKYTLPDEYFANRQHIISSPQAQPFIKPAYTIGTRIKSYAAAAVITFLLAIGSYLFITSTGKEQVANIAANESVKTSVTTLSENEIVDYLIDNATASEAAAYLYNDEPDVYDNVKDMSSEEIQQYLRENEESVNRPDNGS